MKKTKYSNPSDPAGAVVDSLLYGKQSSFIPQDILENSILKKQAALRRKLLFLIQLWLQTKGVMSNSQLTAFYKALSAVLESDPYNRRMLLYLPFEFLPNADFHSESEELNEEIKNFVSVYMKHWHELLSVHDVRANFVDGDILESDIAAQSFPRVSKAAHFIPILLKKKYLDMNDIIAMMKNCNDDVLKESIADALPKLRQSLNIIQKTHRQKRSELGTVSAARLAWEAARYDKEQYSAYTAIDLIQETLAIAAMAINIQSNALLSKKVYPVAIFYGSKVKGYALQNADTDIAIFIKPGTSFQDRTAIQDELKNIFNTEAIRGKAVEFWLDEKLAIQDMPQCDQQLGDSMLSHVLLQGIWTGDKATVQKLQHSLLPYFLYSKNRKYGSHCARRIWLEGMEANMLQYRLLHKGYNRFHAAQDNPDIEHLPLLDPGTFWDPGYRMLAVELFLKKVFLPQL